MPTRYAFKSPGRVAWGKILAQNYKVVAWRARVRNVYNANPGITYACAMKKASKRVANCPEPKRPRVTAKPVRPYRPKVTRKPVRPKRGPTAATYKQVAWQNRVANVQRANPGMSLIEATKKASKGKCTPVRSARMMVTAKPVRPNRMMVTAKPVRPDYHAIESAKPVRRRRAKGPTASTYRQVAWQNRVARVQRANPGMSLPEAAQKASTSMYRGGSVDQAPRPTSWQSAVRNVRYP